MRLLILFCSGFLVLFGIFWEDIFARPLFSICYIPARACLLGDFERKPFTWGDNRKPGTKQKNCTLPTRRVLLLVCFAGFRSPFSRLAVWLAGTHRIALHFCVLCKPHTHQHRSSHIN
jgi:hypothetical protein